jgi:hypothetical protein
LQLRGSPPAVAKAEFRVLAPVSCVVLEQRGLDWVGLAEPHRVHRVVVVVASRAPLRAGYLDCLILVRKSDLPKFFIPKIEEIRNKFQGDHKDHIVFRELQIDGAGEQVSHNIEALLNDVKGGAVETILTDPRRKESAAMIEARVKRSEIGTKTMMLETSMPADEWDYSMLAHIWLSRRVPRQKDIRSRDGDAIRPLEAMSRGRISRATLDHDMSCFPGPPGTPCRLSKTKILGSNVAEAAREEWGVFLKMKGNMPYFKLFKDNKLQYWCHTKDYKVQQLLPGQNYMDFFNIPQTVPKVTLPEPDTGQLIEDNAARIERELQLLHTDPGALIGRDVYMRWIEDGMSMALAVAQHANAAVLPQQRQPVSRRLPCRRGQHWR